MEFVRFPHTSHLAWLGPGVPRQDKVLSPPEVHEFLSEPVVVEEKVDGANVGLRVDDSGSIRAQNRGAYLERETCHPQFKPLFRWVTERSPALVDALGQDLVLFGEWCYAVHSVRYTRLPDWFLAIDVFDVRVNRFWSTTRRDEFVAGLDLTGAPRLASGRFDVTGLKSLLGPSVLSSEPAEGLYIRRNDGPYMGARAKLVRPEFLQAIDAHWSGRRLETNRLAADVVR